MTADAASSQLFTSLEVLGVQENAGIARSNICCTIPTGMDLSTGGPCAPAVFAASRHDHGMTESPAAPRLNVARNYEKNKRAAAIPTDCRSCTDPRVLARA